jgi:hypothetical protein
MKNPFARFAFLLLSLVFITTTSKSQDSKPYIESILPNSGPVGTTVTIQGQNFSVSPDSTMVFFGPVKAQIISGSETTIQVTVPTGATYQPVTVVSRRSSAVSNQFFTPTYVSSGNPQNGLFLPGSFMPKTDLKSSTYSHSVNFTDYNGDGKPDLLVSRGSSERLMIYKNGSTSGNLAFNQPSQLNTIERNSEATILTDFDADGRADIAVVNSIPGRLTIFKNQTQNPPDTFTGPRVNYTTGTGTYCLAAGDLDNDGLPDLALADNGGTKILVFRNKSAGGVLAFDTISFPGGDYPYGIAITDVDGDDRPDIIVSTQGSQKVTVHRNTTPSVGRLQFAAGFVIGSVPGAMDITLGDLDGDGKTDIITSSVVGAIYIMRNTSIAGSIQFDPQVQVNVEAGRLNAALGDIDGDGKVDIITANYNKNSVSVLKNISGPANIRFESPVSYATGAMPGALAVGDIDGDARPDIVTANYSDSNVSIIRNIHGLNLSPVISSFTPTSGFKGDKVTIKGKNLINATGVAFGGTSATGFTVLSDTLVEATISTGTSGDVYVTTPYGIGVKNGFIFTGPTIQSFLPNSANRGDLVTITGTNFSQVSAVLFGGVAAQSFTVMSLTTIHAVVANGGSGNVTVVTANGSSDMNGFSYGQPKILNFAPLSGRVGSIVTLYTKNVHPSPDSVLVQFGAVHARVISISGDTVKVEVPNGSTYKPITLTSNRLVAHSTRPFVATYQNDSSNITAASFSLTGNYTVGAFPRGIETEDFDGDGKPDLVVLNGSSNDISVFRNTSVNGELSFSGRQQYGAGAAPSRISVADLDGDGKKDVIVCNSNSGWASTISVFRNTSSSTAISFAPKAEYAAGAGSTGLATADLNNDGRTDIVVASGNTNSLFFFINSTLPGGAISFNPASEMPSRGHTGYVIAADINNDELPDVIITNPDSRTMQVYRNQTLNGSLSFAAPVGFNTGNYPNTVTAGDLDGNGRTDLIVTDYVDGTATVWLNQSSLTNVSFVAKQTVRINSTLAVLGDTNGDGKPEFVTGSYINGRVAVLQNRIGTSQTNPYTDSIHFEAGLYDSRVSVGDLDGDGKADIALINANSSALKILRNRKAEPSIVGATPTVAFEGTVVTIRGNMLGEMTTVSFGGSPARSFSIVSPNEIVAIVGEGSSGDIVVSGNGGTASYGLFRFIPDIKAEDSTRFCLGDSAVLRSNDNKNNQWYRNGQLIPGATGVRYVATQAGDYWVQTSAMTLVSRSRNMISLQVLSTDQPVMTMDTASLLKATNAAFGQWYLNGTAIAGATTGTYKPSADGLYTFMAIGTECNSPISVPFDFKAVTVIVPANNRPVYSYPNPVTGNLRLIWQIPGSPAMNVQVSDSQGRPVLLKADMISGGTIYVGGLKNGIYYVRIYNETLGISTVTSVLKQ